MVLDHAEQAKIGMFVHSGRTAPRGLAGSETSSRTGHCRHRAPAAFTVSVAPRDVGLIVAMPGREPSTAQRPPR